MNPAEMREAMAENRRLRTEVRKRLRHAVKQLIKDYQARESVRVRLDEAAKGMGSRLSDTQAMKIGKKIGISPEEVKRIAEENGDSDD